MQNVMSALCQERTFAAHKPMSALCQSGHPKLAVALSRISDKYGRARQSDDNFGELAGLRIDID